jgi:isocitrate dehydrogenase
MRATTTACSSAEFCHPTAFKKRGELDRTPKVVEFGSKLEQAAIGTVESGTMTADLLKVAEPGPNNGQVYTEEFIEAVAARLTRSL